MSDTFNKSSPFDDTVPMLRNPQVRRRKPRRKYAIFVTVIPLLLHFFFVATTVCFLSLYLHEHNFSIVHRDRLDDVTPKQGLNKDTKLSFFQRYKPLQTDMITTLSILLVIVRFFLLSWCTDVVWKYMFILLEQTGLSVSQMRDLINYKVLLMSGLPSESLPNGVRMQHFLVALVLFLPLPAQISSPLISGSITWTPVYDYLPGTALPVVPTSIIGPSWQRYQNYTSSRDEVITEAIKLHKWLYASYNDTSLKRSLNTAIPRQLAPGSTVANITIPFFSLSNPAWITDIDVIPSDQLNALGYGDGWIYAAKPGPSESFLGGAALIPPKRWEQAKKLPNSSFEEPSAATISQQLYIAFWPRSRSSSGTCDPSPDVNMTVPDTVAWYSPSNRTCYAFTTVDVIAGAKTCKDCLIENSRAISADETDLAEVPLEPDLLMYEALALTPQIINAMLRSGWEYSDNMPDAYNLEDYVHGVIKRAYILSWSSLMDFMGSEEKDLISSNISIGVASTKAIVSFQRVYLWVASQVLVWVAAGIFAYVQRRCKRPLTADTVMAAIFLDYDDQLQEEVKASGLSDVVVISSKRHNKRLGVLKLEFDPDDNSSYLTQRRPNLGSDFEKEG